MLWTFTAVRTPYLDYHVPDLLDTTFGSAIVKLHYNKLTVCACSSAADIQLLKKCPEFLWNLEICHLNIPIVEPIFMQLSQIYTLQAVRVDGSRGG